MLLTSCAFNKPAIQEVKVITETVNVELYQPPFPPEIQLDDVRWYVITKDNMEEKIAEIEKLTGTEFVVFAITPQGYENMAYNLQEIRRYTRQQKEIILYYVEATKPKGSQEWQENNKPVETTIEIEQEKGFFSRIFGR